VSSNTAGPKAPIEAVWTDRRTEMIAFDRLPPKLREAYNYFPMLAAPSKAIEALASGISEEELLRRIKANEAKFRLSFLEE
jgi:hypothetical protein